MQITQLFASRQLELLELLEPLYFYHQFSYLLFLFNIRGILWAQLITTIFY